MVEQPSGPPPVTYVIFSAEISPHTTESLLATMATIANAGVPHVYLMLSTPGGSVAHGMTLYNVLRAMPFKLTVHNTGNVDSIGNVVFLAGEERYASPHTTFMFHGVGFDSQPGQRFEEKNLREQLDGIASNQTRIANIIADRTSLEREAIKDLFLEAQTKDTAYAVCFGIVHEVRDIKIPDGAPVISLVFQR